MSYHDHDVRAGRIIVTQFKPNPFVIVSSKCDSFTVHLHPYHCSLYADRNITKSMPVSVYNTSMRKENKTELVSHSSFDRIAALKVMPEFDFDTVIFIHCDYSQLSFDIHIGLRNRDKKNRVSSFILVLFWNY